MVIRPIRTMINHSTTEVFFEDLAVPAGNLVGQEGKGFRYILEGMNAERILIAAECIGDARFFLDQVRRRGECMNRSGATRTLSALVSRATAGPATRAHRAHATPVRARSLGGRSAPTRGFSSRWPRPMRPPRPPRSWCSTRQTCTTAASLAGRRPTWPSTWVRVRACAALTGDANLMEGVWDRPRVGVDLRRRWAIPAAEASWMAGEACMQTFGGFAFAEEYDIERKWRETRLYQVSTSSGSGCWQRIADAPAQSHALLSCVWWVGGGRCASAQIAPISSNLILSYISEHVLGLPRSY